MKNNLFIVNTPFHLLTSFILAKGNFRTDNNYLALIHPHSYSKWDKSEVLSFMSSEEGGFKKVFHLIDWLRYRNKEQSYREQVKMVEKKIGRLGIDDVFLGSDIDVQNQLLVGALEKNCFYRYEDGLYSYYNEERRKSFLHENFHQFRIYMIKKIAGIKGKVSINTSTASDNPSGIGDYMYKPWILQRYSPKTYEITKEIISTALKELKERKLLHSIMKGKSILYLSQPLVEKKFFTIEEELGLLKEIAFSLTKDIRLYYKPHPKDRAEKIEYYRKNLPRLCIFDSIDPVELTFVCEKNLAAIISYQSTALMYPDKFADHPIQSISLARFYKKPLHSAYIDIMQNAGVYFPKDFNETIEVLRKSCFL